MSVETVDLRHAMVVVGLANPPTIFNSEGLAAVNPVVRNAQGSYSINLAESLLPNYAAGMQAAVYATVNFPGASSVRFMICGMDTVLGTQIDLLAYDGANALQDGATVTVIVDKFPRRL